MGGGGGGAGPPPPPTTEHEGYVITPTPEATGAGHRIRAIIEKDGLRHELIRADIIRDRDEAVEASIAKARQMIDQQGMRLFDPR
ncbi:MAG: HlyU family transcriptional regulator [Paracoccaceae bacterium]